MSGPICCGDLIEFRRYGALSYVGLHNGYEVAGGSFASLADIDAEATRLMLASMRAGAMFVLDEHTDALDALECSRRLRRGMELMAAFEESRREVKP